MNTRTQVELLFTHDELIVDNFAGGGGASTGIEAAFGRHVDIAINHDRAAVLMHAANHPYTHHYVEDVFKIQPEQVTQGRPVGLAWFSPDCKHFSKAKGAKPVSKKIRGLAWVVTRWAARVKPRVIMLENVEEFQDWGPLRQLKDPVTGKAVYDLHGKPVMVPNPQRKGETFRKWWRQLEKLGYKVEARQLRACDFGAPTIRKRLFIVARRDGQPIVWPTPTHGDPKSDAVRSGKLLPWRTAAECIDWSIPCPSIFERKKELAEATQRRIARGIQRYVIDAAEPFIVPLTHQGSDRVEGINEPFNTVTAAHRGERALVAPVLTEHANASNPRSNRADEPLRTICAEVKGGHHALLTPVLVDAAHGEVSPSGVKRWGQGTRSPENPLPTVTASGGNAAIAVPTLIQTGYGEREGQEPRVPGLEKPLGTVVAGGKKHALVSAFMAKHYGGVVGIPMDEPTGTVTTVDHHSVVAANLIHYHADKRPGDVRASSLDDPIKTQTTENRHAIVTATLVNTANTKTTGRSPGTWPLEEPVRTITSAGSQAVMTAQLVGAGGPSYGGKPKPLTDPVGTLPTENHKALIASTLVALRNNQDGRPVEAPIPTLTAGGGHIAQVYAFLTKYYSEGGQFSEPRDPMATVPTKDRMALVQVYGQQYVIADIGMRMLSPKELYRAQGFPESYIIDVTAHGQTLTKTEQVRMCGNSVCPPVAEALVRANFAAEIAAANIRKAAKRARRA